MTNIKFNPDGSIRKPAKWKRNAEEERLRREKGRVVILRRKQVQTNDPAIGQLWIEFPPNVQPPHNLQELYDKVNERFKTGAVTHHFSKVDDLRYCIEIRSVKMMYSWFEYFIRAFKEEYHNRFNIEDTGFWDKYGGILK